MCSQQLYLDSPTPAIIATFKDLPAERSSPGMIVAMKKSLDEIRAEIAAVNAEAQKLCAGLTEQQLTWRPQPGKWSIAENLAHLNISTQTSLPAIKRSLDEARSRGLQGTGAFDLGFMGKLFVSYLEPPYKMKSKAPKMIQPILQGPATEALPHFLRCNEALEKLIDNAEGVDLGRAVFVSPYARVLRMKLIAAFASVTAHDRRHLWAMGKIREALKSGS
jgi:hypothetical protein